MKITAKEILADKGNIYKNMTKEQLNNCLLKVDDEVYSLLAYFKVTSTKECAKKLWQRWHYKDGRPKPPRVHEVTRLRNELKECRQENIKIRDNYWSGIKDKNALLEKLRNYQSETSQKNIQIINLQGELSKAHNTTKIVAFVLLVIFLGFIFLT